MTNNGLIINYGTIEIVNGGTLTNNGLIVDNCDINTTGTGRYLGNLPTRTGDFDVTGGESGKDYTFDGTTLTVKTVEPLVIANVNQGTATTARITVASGVAADITLEGVNIDVSQTLSACALDLRDAGASTVTLADGSTNFLKSGGNASGLYVPADQKLIINGTGSLDATGGNNWPGIGRNGNGNIEIQSGFVTATGGNNGAGIGGPASGAGSNITISGGTVTATGGSNTAAGIGKGNDPGGNLFGGTFSTTTEGNAFINATSISNASDQASWRGIIFQGENGKVYGDAITLKTDATIPSGKTLTIEADRSLTIDGDTTLTNEGTIDNTFIRGRLIANGTINGNGIIQKKTPSVSDFNIIEGSAYNGNPQGGVTSDAYGIGEIDVTYEGMGDTDYSSSYPPADAGEYSVTVNVSSDAYNYESATGLLVGNFHISKANGPAAPPSVTGDYVADGDALFTYTVDAIQNAEYKMDDGVWQSSNKFTGIVPLTDHTFYARFKESKNYAVGAEGNTGKVTFFKLTGPSTPLNISGSYDDDVNNWTYTIEPILGAEYKIDNDAWQGSNKFTGIEPLSEHAFYVRIKETATHNAGAVSEKRVIFTKLSGPAAPTLTGDYVAEGNTFTYNVVPIPDAEYKMDDGIWQDSSKFSGIKPLTSHTFYVRFKETATHEAGAVIEKEITFTKLAGPNALKLEYEISEGAFPKTITIQRIEGAEYAFNDDVYNEQNMFLVMEAGSVTLSIRMKETVTHEASEATTLQVQITANEENSTTGKELTISGWPENDTIKVGEKFTVTPSVKGGNWTWDKSFFLRHSTTRRRSPHSKREQRRSPIG